MNNDPSQNGPSFPTQTPSPIPPIVPQGANRAGLIVAIVFVVVVGIIGFGVVGLTNISDFVQEAFNGSETDEEAVASDLLSAFTPSGSVGSVFVASGQSRLYAPAGWAFDTGRQWSDGVGCSGEGSASVSYCEVGDIYKTGGDNAYKDMDIWYGGDFDSEVEFRGRIDTNITGDFSVSGAPRTAVFASSSGQTTVSISIIIESPTGEIFTVDGLADTDGRSDFDLSLQDVVDLLGALQVEATDAVL